jgi:hypothetical protein
MQTPLQLAIELLRQQGCTDDNIADVAAELTTASLDLLFSSAMAAFSEEDMQQIEACPTDEEANTKIMELYVLRTGKNPSEQLESFLQTFAKEYIENSKKELTDAQAK